MAYRQRYSHGRYRSSGHTRDYTTVYHYTDHDSANRIMKTGKIKQSRRPYDAVYGPGTYVTKIPPGTDKWTVMENNYDGARSFEYGKMKQGKADVAIEVTVPTSKLRSCPAGGRDVYVYDGDLYLDDAADVKFHTIDDHGRVQTFR